ncbi:hypothetical protein BDK51DRAFT_24900 [Blyttiomyces helicus]|uniref:Uncharacterized protein n=1 Tax=Blyttiomyces helicus TaxID=388810 RepID=A0A4P9WFL1_9FUNG|nr:hypothetical protein BDK51DRAFT_24900 [Blyttiomyces helicus]|eukprot:RKO91549.1 hypothetical protein BDK51DRAFT_24900 [Blyttiomyces helicus]
MSLHSRLAATLARRTALPRTSLTPLSTTTSRILRPYASISSTNPPLLRKSPVEIARRAASVQIFLTRWGIEAACAQARGKGEDADTRTLQGHQAILDTLAQTAIRESMTAEELRLLGLGLGEWTVGGEIGPLWARWESFGVLLWSLRIINGIPPNATPFPRELLFQSTAIIPAFPNTVTEFIEYFATGHGIKPEHIVEERDLSAAVARAEAWYWRSRAQVVLDLKENLKGDSPEQKEARRKIPSGLRSVMENLDKAISAASQRAASEGYIDEIIEDDFGVDGVAYRALDDHKIRNAAELAQMRLGALGWLCGSNAWEWEGELQFIHPMGSLWAPSEI